MIGIAYSPFLSGGDRSLEDELGNAIASDGDGFNVAQMMIVTPMDWPLILRCRTGERHVLIRM